MCKREQLIIKILDESTQALLISTGIKQGMTVMDLGCGSGHTAIKLAELVGYTGQVHAIDRDEEKIQQVYELKKEYNLPQLQIHCVDANSSLDFCKSFDCIFSRFFYLNNTNPINLITRMINYLKPQGLMVFEEPVLEVTRDQPLSSLWTAAIEAYSELAKRTAVNPNYGWKLPYDVEESGLSLISARLIQNIIKPELAQEYILASIASHRDEYLKEKVLTTNQLESLVDSIENFDISNIEYSLFHGLMQVIARRRNDQTYFE